ncbi:MAG TPA: hypothetical protein VGJ66_15300 [Pyrinomonadaceae bacterium]|jgi:hypothetical protein
MYTMIKRISYGELLLEQLPVLTASLLIAEFFYRFHSFTLECVAFLTIWYALDAGIKLLRDDSD